MDRSEPVAPWLAPLAALAMLGAILWVFLVAPPPSSAFTAPLAFRLFYFHVPAAWAGYLAFFVTFVASASYLRSRDRDRDRLAAASAEVGTVLISIALFSGMAWARAEWGVFWRWDLKLIMVLVLWLTYVAYNAVRATIRDPEVRARTSAVFGVVGFAGVPLSYAAGQIWVTLHPNLVGARAASLSPDLGQALGVAMVAFTLLYAALAVRRFELARIEDELAEAKDDAEEVPWRAST